MDALLIYLREIKRALNFKGSNEELLQSPELIEFCLRTKRIPKVSPSLVPRENRDKLSDLLRDITKEYLSSHPDIHSWKDLEQKPDTKKIHKLLHDFGVRGELFPYANADGDEENRQSPTSLTLEEFYELCKIQFNFNGSFGSFKKFVAKQYGSFAEYCILKGYDINNNKWENDEIALRVAAKLGTIDEVKIRSNSLFRYLSERSLLDKVQFEKKR